MPLTKPHNIIRRSAFNSVVRLLTLEDIFVWGPLLVAAPLLGIYLNSKFGIHTVGIVGMGTAIYYSIRGLVQIPIGKLVDRIKSDHDEIALLVLGCLLMAIPYFFIPSITESWHYFILQAIGGLGASLNIINWRKLFIRNLNKNHEGYTYGVYETVLSLSTAVLSMIGGYLSEISLAVFTTVIYVVGFFVASGGIVSAILYTIKDRKSE